MVTRRYGMRRSIIAILACASIWVSPDAQTRSSATVALNETTIDALSAALRDRTVSCRAVVEHYLARIEAYDKRGPALNAVQTVNRRALEEAERLDSALRASGPTGPLHCVPVLVKDQFETADVPTTFGSAAFKDFVPARDATAVARLRRAGALILAKATMGEFASGYAGSLSGPVRNPYDLRRHASGSSSGSGAGVAADFATVSLAEDTGGSIRGPASVASLVGHRPTLPLVSRYGMLPARPTSDTAGPITRTVKDAAILLDVLAGYDPLDPVTAYAVTHLPASFAGSLRREALAGTRLGVLRQPLHPDTDAGSADYRAIHSIFDRALGELRTLGAETVAITVLGAVSGIVRAGYDGNVFETEAAIDAYLAQLVNPPVKSLRALLVSGRGLLPWRARTLMSTVGRTTRDPGYLQVLHAIEDTRRAVLALMADHQLDALVYTTGDHHPALIAPDIMTNPDVVGDTRLGSNRALAAVLAFPAVTVPAGLAADGVPVGLEFLGRAFDDAKILGYAYAYEQATRHRRPPTSTPPLARRTR